METAKRTTTGFMGHALLLLVTLVPLIGLPAAYLVGGPPAIINMPGLAVVVAMTGTGHVATTAYLYVDGGYRDLVRSNPLRMLVVPVAVVTTYGLVCWHGGTAWFLVTLFHAAWQLFHYQRQNYGMLALASRTVSAGPPPREVNTMLHAGVVAGVLGAIGPVGWGDFLLPTDPATSDLVLDAAYLVAVCAQGVVAVAAVLLLVRRREYSAHPLVRAWIIAVALFFAPAVVTRDSFSTFWSYAIAHGAQYLLLTVVLAARSRGRVLAVIGYVVLGTAVWKGMTWMTEQGGFLAGAQMGIVAAHFVVDAKVWRLREPVQRALINTRLAFLFPAAPPRN